MGIQSASPLYPINSTTVDSGAGIDIRLLSDAEGGADVNQTVNFTHTQDNVERTWDPDAASDTNVRDARTLQKLGWGLRLADDCTPSDDTNCDAYLEAQTFTMQIAVTLSQSGGTYASGTCTPTFRAALFKYNVSTDTGSLIADGSNTNSWTLGAGGDIGTRKNTSISVTIAATSFGANEIPLMQLGLNSGTVPNPTLGTGNFSATLTTDNSNTLLTWASGKSLSVLCLTTGSITGNATVTDVGSLVLGGAGSVSASAAIAAISSAFGVGTGSITATDTMLGVSSAFGLASFEITETSTIDGSGGLILGGEFEIDTGGSGGGNTYPRDRVVNQ